MKITRIFSILALSYMLLFSCNKMERKVRQESTVPQNEEAAPKKEIPLKKSPVPEKNDSEKSIKKKRSKAIDSLKPIIAKV